MKRLIPVMCLLLLAYACSTTRVLEEGEYRLTSNEINIKGGGDLKASQISPYIRQSAQGWTPMLYVYNWSKKDGLFHKIGTAPELFDSTSVASSVSNIATHLDYLGYYRSGVQGEIIRKGKKAKVRYTIYPGKRYKIDSLSFEIPDGGTFPADFYSDSSAAVKALMGEWLSEDILEDESVRSASVMRDLGYFDFNKNNYSFEADTLADGTATLIYRVREYSRNETEAAARPISKYYIGNVGIKRPADFPFREKVLKDLNTIHPGDLYSEKSVNNTYSRLSSIRAFSTVAIEMTPRDSNLVDCGISLSRSPQQGFKVNLEASTNSLGLFSVSPQLSFFHKNVFHGGEWLNLGFSGDFQRRPSDNARAVEYGITAGLSLPRFVGLPYSIFKGPRIPRTEINFTYNYQDRPEYNRAIIATAFGYSGTTGNRNISYQIYPLQVNFVRLFNLDPGFASSLEGNPFMRYSYQNHLDAGVGATFYYNSSTDIVPQGTYKFRRLSFDLSGNVLSLFRNMMHVNSDGAAIIAGSPYSQYVRGEYSWGKAWRYGQDDNQAVALRLLVGAGYAYGNSTTLPFEKQFYVGGSSSMRGWQARALGPGAEVMNGTFIIPSQTGDFKLETNLEYRFNLFWKLEGALFADVGNVWNMLGDPESAGAFRINDFYKTLAADWGLGIRVNLTFILLRLDFGMQVYDPSQPEDARMVSPRNWLKGGYNALHFGVGYPF